MSSVWDWTVSILVLLGTVFVVLSGIGILRMPDLFCRMQVVTKATTLGVALIMAGVAVRYGGTPESIRAGLVVLFLFLTAPVGAHMLARAAYRFRDVPLSPKTRADEWRDDIQRGVMAPVRESDSDSEE